MKNQGKKWTHDEDNKLITLVNQNLEIAEISHVFQRTELAIKLRIRRHKIQRILDERQIKKLVHFTDVRNSSCIKKHGLLSIEELKKQNLKYFYNDEQRLDNLPNFISLSVTNINSFLLNAFNERNKRAWIRFDIDPKVLLRADNFFFHTNAASSIFPDNKDNEQFSTPEAFLKMFELEVSTSRGYQRRKNHQINETTCAQAEILVKRSITRHYIIGWELLK